MPRGGGTVNTNLADLGDLTTTGLVAHTAATTWAARELTQPAAGITVADGDGVSGDPTLALANDLAAVEALASAGIAARTATDTWAVRTLTGTTNQVNIADGDGVSDNPTFSLPQSIHTAAVPTFARIVLTSSNDGDVQSSFANTSTGTSARCIVRFSNDNTNCALMYYGTNHTTLARHMVIANNDASGDIRFWFNGGYNLYLNNDGNFGFGKAPGSMMDIDLATEDLEIVDAGSAGATEQDWVEVKVGGNTGYLRVYAAV